MRLDLNEVATHLRKRIEYQINEPPLEDIESGVKCVKPVTGRLVFQNTGNLVVVMGRFSTALELECSRCLKSFAMDVDIAVDEGFSITGVPDWEDLDDSEVEAELPEDSKEPLFENNIFNLTELIRQLLAVSVPIRTVCSEECKGICPGCGMDLGEGPCQCKESKSDSPFAALSSLLEESEEE